MEIFNSSNNIQISVVIPMRNAEKYIEKTLLNILQQQKINFEIIVVDDKSTDQSANIVKSFGDNRIILINGLGLGIAEALNVGYKHTNSEIIVRCDADDFICPDDRLYRQYTFLNNNVHYQAVCGNFSGIDQHDNNLGSFNCGDTQLDITENVKKGYLKSHFGTYAIKKELFNKLGGFRNFFITAEDVDFQLRIVDFTKIMYFPDQWYAYRLHAESITHTQRENTRHKFEEAAKLFQKQRLISGQDDLERGVASPIDEKRDSSNATPARDHAINLAIASSWQLHEQHQKKSALNLLFKIYKKNPTSFNTLKNLILLALKNPK